ncbi:hypothetical protein BJ912DRAFT_91613 [Pholiota molesta]|nr:hypothetical protein BJ912DRAFT_91613 [Pholiota molesta]
MLSAVSKATFVRSLCLSSTLRFAKPGAAARCLIFVESKRTFMTTASVAEEVETTKEKEATKDEAAKELSGARKQMKIPYKRPSTSWQNFYRDYLKDHMEPGDTYTAYAAEASALWKAMSAEDKARYGASEEERAEYKRLSKEYRATQKAQQKAAKPKREPKTRGDAPMSAYGPLFVESIEKSLRELFSENTTLVERWRKDIRAAQEAQMKAAKSKREPKTRDAPMSAYNLFVKENYDKNLPESFFRQNATLAKRWREMSASDKHEYKQRAIEIYQKRKAEVAEKQPEDTS